MIWLSLLFIAFVLFVFVSFLITVILVAFAMSTFTVNEDDGSFEVCIHIVNGIINDGQTLFVEYTLQDDGM